MFFKNSPKIGKIGPIAIHMDWLWLVIFGVITYGISQYLALALKLSYLPIPLGIMTAIIFYACMLMHELAHSFVAIKTGIPVKRITLIIIGLVAHLEKGPERPGQEFKIAIAGPLTNIIIAGIIYSLLTFCHFTSPVFLAICKLLFWPNIIWAIFNLIPAFPMDGGRVLRSIIWFFVKNQIKATKIAVWVARIFALLMVASVFTKFGSVWLIMIAFFIFTAGTQELNALIIQEKLGNKKVRDVMKPLTQQEFEEYLKCDVYVVEKERKIIYCQPEDTLWDALRLMQANGTKKLFVKESNQVIGLVDEMTIIHILNKK